MHDPASELDYMILCLQLIDYIIVQCIDQGGRLFVLGPNLERAEKTKQNFLACLSYFKQNYSAFLRILLP
jgi:hypothetical protein